MAVVTLRTEIRTEPSRVRLVAIANFSSKNGSFSLSKERDFHVMPTPSEIAALFRHLRSACQDYDSCRFYEQIHRSWPAALRTYYSNPNRRSTKTAEQNSYVLRRNGQRLKPNNRSHGDTRFGLPHAGFDSPLRSVGKQNEQDKLKTPETLQEQCERTGHENLTPSAAG